MYKLPYHVKYWELIKDYVIANVVLLTLSLENQENEIIYSININLYKNNEIDSFLQTLSIRFENEKNRENAIYHRLTITKVKIITLLMRLLYMFLLIFSFYYFYTKIINVT